MGGRLQPPLISDADRQPGRVQMLQKRQGVLTASLEPIPDLCHRDGPASFKRLGDFVDDPAVGLCIKGDVLRDLDEYAARRLKRPEFVSDGLAAVPDRWRRRGGILESTAQLGQAARNGFALPGVEAPPGPA